MSEKRNHETGKPGRRVRVLSVPELHYPVRVEEEVRAGVAGVEDFFRQDAMAAGHVLAKVKGTPQTTDLLVALRGAGIVGLDPVGGSGVVKVHLVAPTPDAVPVALEALRAAPDWIEYAEPDYLVYTTQIDPNDPAYAANEMWGLRNTGQFGGLDDGDIDADEAWATRTDASNIIVAVIDTGVRDTHEDLQANMWRNPGEIPGDGIDNDTNGVIDDVHGYNAINESGDAMDDYFHGTHVAGTIGAVGNNGAGGVGVAWRVQLMAVKFLSSSGSGFTSDAVKAVDYARTNGAHILNNSWGGGGFAQSLYDAIERCRQQGVIFVAAAGNNGQSTDQAPHYPSSYPHDNIVSVGAMTRTEEFASFSNHGLRSVDIAAPGAAIYSAYNSADDAYHNLSGTSMASPHIAGALALLKAEYPNLSYLGLIDRLLSTADRPSAYGTRTRCQGRLNLARALTASTFLALPTIVEQPNETNVLVGGTVTLTVVADGASPLNYQWRRQGRPILGATTPTLTLAQVQKADTGRYTVLVSNPSGVALSEEIVLSVHEPVSIAAHPAGATVALDATVTLNVSAAGDSPLSYQWRKDGLDLVGATSAVFTIYGALPADTGVYTVFVSNPVSSLESAAASVTVVLPPSVDVSAADQESVVGGSVTFRIAASGGEPLSYQWFRDGQVIPAAESPSLTLSNLALNAAGAYSVRVTNLAGTVWDEGAGLSVRNSEGSTNAPRFTLHPGDVVVNAGTEVLFSTTVTPEGVTYQWRKDGMDLAGAHSNSLWISAADVSHAGIYTLVAMNAEGWTASRGARLTLRQAPVITQQPQSASQVPGSQVVLEAGAIGTGPLFYQWFKDGSLLAGATARRFMIAMLDVGDTGTYTLMVSNLAGSAVSAPVTVSLASSSLTRWRQLAPDLETFHLSSVSEGPDGIYVGSQDGTFSVSQDGGRTWTRRRAGVGPGRAIHGMVYAAGRYVALARETDNSTFSLISSDGLSWQRHAVSLGPAYRLNPRHDGSAFYTVQNGYNFGFSEDGTNWTSVGTGSIRPLFAVVYGADRYVAVGEGGVIFTSTDRWIWERVPSPSREHLFGVIWSEGLFIAVGDSGHILTSPDGLAWTLQPAATSERLYSVAYGNGRFVAVGGISSGATLVSTNGTTWRRTPNHASASLADVGFVHGVFVAAGGVAFGGGGLITSEDGEEWTLRTPEEARALTAIAHGNGTFVAVGMDGIIRNSQDGLTWNTVRRPQSEDLTTVAFGNGRFVAGTVDGGLYTSFDGLTWGHQRTGASAVTCLRYLEGRFFALLRSGEILSSPDAESWVRAPSVGGAALWHIAWGGELFVAVGEDGMVRTSAEGQDWTARPTPTRALLRGVAYGAGKFVAVGDKGIVLSSSDGVTWDLGSTGRDVPLFGLAYGNNVFAAGGGNPAMLVTSTDGVTWIERAIPGGSSIYRVEFLNGGFAAAGSGTVLHSTDGITWTPSWNGGGNDITHGQGQYLTVKWPGRITTSTDLNAWTSTTLGTFTSFALSDVKFQGGMFLACGYNGKILTSTNGQDWISQASAFNGYLNSFAYGAGKHLLLAANNTILSSSNGVQWEQGAIPGAQEWRNIHYAGGQFVVVGSPPAAAVSPDGVHWTSRSLPSAFAPSLIQYGNGIYLAATSFGEILTSRDGLEWLQEEGIESYLGGLCFADGKFLISAANGQMLSSTDGKLWLAHERDNTASLYRMLPYEEAVFGVSEGGVVSISAPLPRITQQPLSQQVRVGRSLSLSVAAQSPGQLQYQWFKEGQPIPGANGSTLVRLRASRIDAGSYTVRISGLGGTVDSIAAKIMVTERPFDTWRLSHFREEDFLDASKEDSLWGIRADPDRDRLPTLAEYAYGLDPSTPDPRAPLEVELVGGRLRVHFPRRINDPALTVIPEVSAELVNWQSGPGVVHEVGTTALANGLERVTVEAVEIMGFPGQQFLRVRVHLDD